MNVPKDLLMYLEISGCMVTPVCMPSASYTSPRYLFLERQIFSHMPTTDQVFISELKISLPTRTFQRSKA
jgi:hypothetical protein